MTNEALCKRIRAGEADLINQLIRQNHGMIYKVAAQYNAAAERNRGLDLDDLLQAVTVGLILSVDTWDESRGSFIAYAVMFMRREARNALGILSTKQRIENVCPPASINEPFADTEDCTLEGMLADENAVMPSEACEANDKARCVREAVQELPEVQRAAIGVKYFGWSGTPNPAEARRGIRLLSRNKAIMNLLTEYNDSCYRRKSIARFNTTYSSVVEGAVIRRERIRSEIDARIAGVGDPCGVPADQVY